MKCIDEEYNIFGDFNSGVASNLMITFEVCDESVRKCKSKQKIKEALAYSYLYVLENEKFYIQNKTPRDRDMISRNTKSSWHALSATDRFDYARKIHVEHIHYNKYNIGLGVSDKEVVEPIFHCDNSKTRLMSY